jgi:hypothetical protein
MRIIVVDPAARAIRLLEEKSHPDRFAQRHVGRGRKVEWSTVSSTADNSNLGLGVAMDEDGLRRPNQRFFRLSRVPVTFPGTCVLFGMNGDMVTDAPVKFLEEVARKVIFCPPETSILRIDRKMVPIDHPKMGQVPVMWRIPVFGQKRNDYEQ